MDREMNGQRRLTPEERAIRVKQLKRKRMFRLAIVIAAFALMISIIISPIIIFAVLRVKNFTVEGAAKYQNEEIIAASGIAYGKSLVFADLDEAAAAIEKTLPYTNNVKLTKKLPNGIVIRLEETSTMFAVEIGNGMYALTNGEMKVLELSGDLPDGITLITGAIPLKAEPGSEIAFAVKDDEQGDRTLELLKNISKAMASVEVKDIDLINISSRASIYMIHQERIVIRLGDSNEIERRLSLALRVIKEEENINPINSGIVTSTILGQASFNPSDEEDIAELVEYKEKYASEKAETDAETEENSGENTENSDDTGENED